MTKKPTHRWKVECAKGVFLIEIQEGEIRAGDWPPVSLSKLNALIDKVAKQEGIEEPNRQMVLYAMIDRATRRIADSRKLLPMVIRDAVRGNLPKKPATWKHISLEDSEIVVDGPSKPKRRAKERRFVLAAVDPTDILAKAQEQLMEAFWESRKPNPDGEKN